MKRTSLNHQLFHPVFEPRDHFKMSSSVTEANLEKKFRTVTNTQDCIQTLSLWILHHKVHHQKIVNSWMKVLQKAKISHRLALFYLTNDVVQNGKRKGVPQFGNSFAEVLREATLLVRDEHIRPAIQRVFNIWEQRGVYDAAFIADLQAILANTKVPASAPSKLLTDFKHEVVVEKLRSVVKLKVETTSKIATINLTKLNATNAEIVQQLKDRMHGQQFSRDFDESTRSLEELIKTMGREIKERTELILLLEQSEIYYDTQRGEAKIVANAYKNFGGRVKALQKKLEELAATFSSPIPSPCPDAPSPTTSEQEMELDLPNDKVQTNEMENLENVPSPVGSPEGLDLSPKPKDLQSESSTPQNVGNPIPTVSNFFTQEQSGMTSWLDTFANKKKPVAPQPSAIASKKSDPSSLDSRLSNLLQNIPNLPSGLQSTLFGSSVPAVSTQPTDDISSPESSKKGKVPDAPSNIEATTPIKDECSGQNTPLQDEDNHSSNQAAFFSRLASSTKTQSPKDILKGLTSLINSASGSASEKPISDSLKKESFPYNSPDPFEQKSGTANLIKKIAPSAPEINKHSGSPSAFFNSPQHPVASPVSAGTTMIHSYQTSTFSEVTSYSAKSTSSKNIQEHMSFIPTLVPSTPHDGTFNFTAENFPLDEYNPEVQSFETDMDIEDSVVAHVHNAPSPEILDSEPLSPTSEISKLPRPSSGRRHSTLITVVTKDTRDESNLPVDKPFTSDSVYETQECGNQELSNWTDNSASVSKDMVHLPPQNILSENPIPPSEEFPNDRDERIAFFSTNPPPVMDHNPTNGQGHSFSPLTSNSTDWSMSKIETVQTHRKDISDNRWFGDNWTDFENTRQGNAFGDNPHLPYRPLEPRMLEHKRGFHHPNFHPRNNWPHRERPEINSFHHPYGPPPPPKRFAFRGRGWGRRQPQY